MASDSGELIEWVVLTMGDRPAALAAALTSLDDAQVLVVANGGRPMTVPAGVREVALDANLGVPGGRHEGVTHSSAGVVAFLDDDAVASPRLTTRLQSVFEADERLGAVALRLVDEQGETARRHVPRLGGRGADRSGDVALFLGGACAIRRDAYLDAGGYFVDLFYGHEELELAWRLVDRGWRIHYLADALVTHPRTEIGRHADGWRMTGRNRVAIARRTLPWPVAIVHVATWLLLGLWRAPGRAGRAAYLGGWWSGWSMAVDRRPIRWRTVWRLTRLGRPPVV